MIHAIGYACISLGLPDRSISRTVRVANATAERLRELVHANLTDLLAILEYNSTNHFQLFRLNQSLIPLASHPVNTLHWWSEEEFAPMFRVIGDFIKRHCLRVSMHPGQYTVLNSENPLVVEAGIAKISASCCVLDAMGLDGTHKIVVHGGAGKPDHPAALARLAETWVRLPEHVRARLVLENDDTTFSIEELLPICRSLGIPLVFDWLHHGAQPGGGSRRELADIFAEVAPTWMTKDGIPKTHFSSQQVGKRIGAHAYWLDPQEFLTFAGELEEFTVDVMAECKGKDLALIRLREVMNKESTPGRNIFSEGWLAA